MGSKRDSYSSDRELVDRALRGDEEATGAIARMLSDLTSLALRKLQARGVTISDPQNLAAEVSFQILVQDPRSALGRYRGESALRTFLWQVVRYKVIDRVRGQKLRPSLPLEDAPPITSPPPRTAIETSCAASSTISTPSRRPSGSSSRDAGFTS